MTLDPQGADLSIVVQGALFVSNVVQIASYCEHWRALLPQAEIVLAVSSSDMLGVATPPGRIQAPRVAPTQASALEGAALRSLWKTCDVVVLARAALPLPRFKADAGLNNFNLQLAAAQAGLAQARRTYVLRTRSDLVFLTRDFLEHYESDRRQPRGDAARLRERIMISPLFTLDPFSVERMPLHHSDWFHLGLLEDVRRLWAIPPISLADAAFYRAAEHSADSTGHERLFLTRLAVEQHLMFNAFAGQFPQLRLDRHNDRRSLELSLKILRDNFVVSDLQSSACLFDKYAQDIAFVGNRHSCVTREDWLAMCRETSGDVTVPLRRKFARVPPDRESDIPSAHFRAGQLLSGQALRLGGSISSPSGACVLLLEPRGLRLIDAARPEVALWRVDADEPHDLRLQPDGNLVLYSHSDAPLWASNTSEGDATCLEVTDGGQLELWSGTTRVWTSASAAANVVPESWTSGRLPAGAQLNLGETLRSSEGRREIGLTARGLALRDVSSGGVSLIFEAGPSAAVSHLIMQNDGNLVVYALSGEALWSSDTQGHHDACLVIDDDGTVSLCGDGGTLRVLESGRHLTASAMVTPALSFARHPGVRRSPPRPIANGAG